MEHIRDSGYMKRKELLVACGKLDRAFSQTVAYKFLEYCVQKLAVLLNKLIPEKQHHDN